MQFDRSADGTLTPLPRPSIDTGMGLERIAAVLQGVHSNYEIDLFQQLIAAAARETNTSDLNEASLRVIADHIRACAFLVLDGVIPGNEGRGYVLRRIIRRALRHGYQLGCKTLFFHRLVDDLALAMGAAYPELVQAADRVVQVLRAEEERFAETLDNGMRILETALQRAKHGLQVGRSRPLRRVELRAHDAEIWLCVVLIAKTAHLDLYELRDGLLRLLRELSDSSQALK